MTPPGGQNRTKFKMPKLLKTLIQNIYPTSHKLRIFKSRFLAVPLADEWLAHLLVVWKVLGSNSITLANQTCKLCDVVFQTVGSIKLLIQSYSFWNVIFSRAKNMITCQAVLCTTRIQSERIVYAMHVGNNSLTLIPATVFCQRIPATGGGVGGGVNYPPRAFNVM